MVERDGLQTPVTEAISFVVTPLREGALPRPEPEALANWYAKAEQLQADVSQMEQEYRETLERAESMRHAYDRATVTDDTLRVALIGLRDELLAWNARYNGSTARAQLYENEAYPILRDYLQNLGMGNYGNTYGGTDTHRASYAYADALFTKLRNDLKAITARLPEFENRLNAIGAPPVKGLR